MTFTFWQENTGSVWNEFEHQANLLTRVNLVKDDYLADCFQTYVYSFILQKIPIKIYMSKKQEECNAE